MLGIRNVSESCAATFQCQAINTYNMVEHVRRNITLKVVSKGKFKVSMEVGWCHGKKKYLSCGHHLCGGRQIQHFLPWEQPASVGFFLSVKICGHFANKQRRTELQGVLNFTDCFNLILLKSLINAILDLWRRRGRSTFKEIVPNPFVVIFKNKICSNLVESIPIQRYKL